MHAQCNNLESGTEDETLASHMLSMRPSALVCRNLWGKYAPSIQYSGKHAQGLTCRSLAAANERNCLALSLAEQGDLPSCIILYSASFQPPVLEVIW